MPKPTLTLAMICKDEEPRLATCLDSVKPYVDEIVIADTGSVDKTKAVAESYGAKVVDCNPTTHPHLFYRDDEATLKPLGVPPPYSNELFLCDFGGARNVGFEHATGDFIMWQDADDVLVGADKLPAIVQELADRQFDACFWPYHYGHDDKGRLSCTLLRERIVRRGTATWVNPIHEVLAPIRGDRSIRRTDITTRHARPAERTVLVANRNFKVIVQYLKNHPEDARHLFYLGNEARFLDPDKAIAAYERYVELSGWDEERAFARVYLGELFESRRQIGRAYAQYAAATVDKSSLPDGWFALGRIAYFQNNWAECARLMEEGFKRGDPDGVIMFNPLSRSFIPHVYYHVALNHLGRVEEALASCEKGLAIVSEEPNLNHNRRIFQLYLADKTDPVKLALASERTPQKVKDAISQALSEMRAPTKVTADPGKLSIVVWTGPAVEWWSPKSPESTGIGGSETAVIEMCRHWAALGHKVVVYSDCPHMDGVYDGVDYQHFGAFSGVECDVFISSRQPGVIEHTVKAGVKLLWVHDIHCGMPDPNMHRWLLKYDRLLCLSEWHKRYVISIYKFLHPEHIIVTRNGIDPERFAGDLPPKKNRLVYSSSPNRGLDVLLDLFPKVRAEVPDVELHVFYGFESWDKAARAMGNQAELELINAYQRRLRETPGVIYRGRVAQRQLAREFMEAKVWAYPTAFTETSCITAVECQAAGCVPVTSEVAALSESVHSGILIRGANTDPVYQEAWVKAAVQMLTDDEMRRDIIAEGRPWALARSWESLAREWLGLFEQIASDRVVSLVPRYESMTDKAA